MFPPLSRTPHALRTAVLKTPKTHVRPCPHVPGLPTPVLKVPNQSRSLSVPTRHPHHYPQTLYFSPLLASSPLHKLTGSYRTSALSPVPHIPARPPKLSGRSGADDDAPVSSSMPADCCVLRDGRLRLQSGKTCQADGKIGSRGNRRDGMGGSRRRTSWSCSPSDCSMTFSSCRDKSSLAYNEVVS